MLETAAAPADANAADAERKLTDGFHLVIEALTLNGVSRRVIGILPRAARRLPLPALIGIAVLASIVGMILLFVAYGAPLSPS